MYTYMYINVRISTWIYTQVLYIYVYMQIRAEWQNIYRPVEFEVAADPEYKVPQRRVQGAGCGGVEYRTQIRAEWQNIYRPVDFEVAADPEYKVTPPLHVCIFTYTYVHIRKYT